VTEAVTQARSVYIWVAEGTWRATVDAALDLAPAGSVFTLLHVTPGEVPDAVRGAYAGLFGRAGRDPATRRPGWSRWRRPRRANCSRPPRAGSGGRARGSTFKVAPNGPW